MTKYILIFIFCISSIFYGDITALYYSDNNLVALLNNELRIYSSDNTSSIKLNEQLKRPLGVAINKDNEIYIVDTGNNCVKKFNKNGELLMKFGSKGINDNEFIRPSGIVIDFKNNIFVSDTGNNCIKKFDQNGKFLLKFGRRGYGNSEFINPYHVIVDKKGNIYVVDVGNNAVKKFDNNGNFILKIDTDLSSVSDVAIDTNENIYIADFDSRCIKIFNKDGKFQRIFKTKEEFIRPVCISISNLGEIAIFDSETGILKIYDKNEQNIIQYNISKKYNYWFGWLYDIAIDKDENIYATFFRRDIIVKYDKDGNYVESYGGNGTADGLFKSPRGIAIDNLGKIYIADLFNNRIQIYSNEGKFLSCFENINYPMYLTIDKENNIYAGDTGNGTIKKYSSDGKLLDEFSPDTYFNPGDIAIDKENNIYVVNTLNQNILVIGPDKKLKNSYNFNLKLPHSIAVDSKNNIYIFDVKDSEIKIFKDGNLVSSIKIKIGYRESIYGGIVIINDSLYFFNGTTLKKFPL